MAAGLVAAHRDRDLVIAHLAAAPGVSGAWTPEALDDLVPDISGEDVAPAGGPE